MSNKGECLVGWQGWCSGLVLCMLECSGLNPALCNFFFFFFFFFLSLKFSKFMPVLFIGTGAGAVDTASWERPQQLTVCWRSQELLSSLVSCCQVVVVVSIARCSGSPDGASCC